MASRSGKRFGFVSGRTLVSRDDVLTRFGRDDEALVRGVLHDLAESGLVFCSGNGGSAVYRAVSEDELRYLHRARSDNGADELVWAVVYREGPLGREQLLARAGTRPDEIDACVQRLLDAGRIKRNAADQLVTGEFFVARDAEVGWEAAVFDHYHAVVRTVCCRLNPDPELRVPSSAIGGSTYTFDVWPEHPLLGEVLGSLDRFRASQTDLRRRVEEHNARQRPPASYWKLVSYAGQSLAQTCEEK